MRNYPKSRQSFPNLSIFPFRSFFLIGLSPDGNPPWFCFVRPTLLYGDKPGFFGFHPGPSDPSEFPGVLSQFTPISGKTGGSRLTTTTLATGVSVKSRTVL
jgi:hypothetical protein